MGNPFYTIMEQFHFIADQKALKGKFSDNGDFKNERDMGDWIEKHIHDFCIDVLGSEYVSHEREYPVGGGPHKGSHNLRVDFVIKTKDRTYWIELKHPRHAFTEMTRAVGQMMAYSCYAGRYGRDVDLILVSDKHESLVNDMICKYKLDFRYVLLNKHWYADMVSVGVGNGQRR